MKIILAYTKDTGILLFLVDYHNQNGYNYLLLNSATRNSVPGIRW